MDKEWKFCIVGLILGIAIGSVSTYFIRKPKQIPNVPSDTITIIKHKRDSVLQTINDTIIETIEKEYEKVTNELLTLPPDKQCDIFSSYLSKNAWRLSGGNNSRANENK